MGIDEGQESTRIGRSVFQTLFLADPGLTLSQF